MHWVSGNRGHRVPTDNTLLTYLKRFEEVVISGGVDWLKDQVLIAAQEFRSIQTGRIQEYVLVSVLIGWALAVVILLINSGFLDGIF